MTATVIEAAVRALVFAMAVGAVLRLLRVGNVPVRKAVWSLVLIASLAMPLLMRWTAVASWSAPRIVPLWVQRVLAEAPSTKAAPVISAEAAVAVAPSAETPDTTVADPGIAPTKPALLPVLDGTAATTPMAPGEAPSKARFHAPPVGWMVVTIDLAIAGVLLMRLLWGLAMALRLWVTAERVSPLVAPEPNVRASARVASPVTIGSGIVLPANYIEWDSRKLRMVLAHERSHVCQMDFYLQLLAGLYTAFFWFSPLGWWLRHALASLGEAIGDRAGMDAAASRSRYAEVLLEFAAIPRQTLPGVAMARSGNLSGRVERLLNERLFRSAFAEGKRRALVSLGLIPVALLVATAVVRVQGAAAQTAPAAPTAPAAAPAPALPPAAPGAPTAVPALPAPPAGEAPTGVPPSAVSAPAAAAMPAAPSAAVAPVAPFPPDVDTMKVDDSSDVLISNEDQESKGYSWGFSDDGESYALIEGPGNDVTFSGSWNSERKAEIDAARKMAKGPFLWFTHEGKSYIVTDPATIASIRAMYKPMEALGQQQEALGKQQEALGRRMAELGKQQEAAGRVKMPDLSKEMAELNAAVEKFNGDRATLNPEELAEAEAKLKAAQDQMLTPEKMAALQAKIAATQAQWSSEKMADMEAKLGELQARLGELQGEAGARQGEFGARMGALGEQQGNLGAEQGRLGAEQGRLAQRIDRQVRGIIEDCLRNGKATRVPQVQ